MVTRLRMMRCGIINTAKVGNVRSVRINKYIKEKKMVVVNLKHSVMNGILAELLNTFNRNNVDPAEACTFLMMLSANVAGNLIENKNLVTAKKLFDKVTEQTIAFLEEEGGWVTPANLN